MANVSNPPAALPPHIGGAHGEIFDYGEDSARYILGPNQFYRPYLRAKADRIFVWPLGIEGFTIRGSAGLGVHKYIGSGDIDVDVMFPDEEHIEMSGTFPGKTAVQHFFSLKAVILSSSGTDGKQLWLPLIYRDSLRVEVEDYNFTHDEGDRTRTIAYTLTFIKVNMSARTRLDDPGTAAPNPTVKPGSDKGKPKNTTKVTVTHNTLKKIASKYSDDPRFYVQLMNLNPQLGSNAAYRTLSPGTVIRLE